MEMNEVNLNYSRNKNESNLEMKNNKETKSNFRETENLDVIREDDLHKEKVEVDIGPSIDKI